MEKIMSKESENIAAIIRKRHSKCHTNVVFARNFAQNDCIMRRKRKNRRNKREQERKRLRRAAIEQARVQRNAQRYAKEMRNREVLKQAALARYAEALATPSLEDDMLIEAALGSRRSLDRLVYNISPSDTERIFERVFNDISEQF